MRLYNELEHIQQQINECEQRIRELEVQQAEADFSLEEAIYRRAVAEVYDTLTGRPRVVDRARLEEERLRLGIMPRRAKALEEDIRSALTEEIFPAYILREVPVPPKPLNDWDIDNPPVEEDEPERYTYEPGAEAPDLLRAIRLHIPTAARLFYAQAESHYEPEYVLLYYEKELRKIIEASPFPQEYQLVTNFMIEV